jgi:phosphoribosylaminoimidazolecarboxamide formyltransferase/IMP cyclohydrolase
MSDLKKMYKTIMDDNFPDSLTIKFGEQTLVYRKRAWKIPDEKTGELIEKGLRYGENPDQQAALFELVNGNLVLGDCRYIEAGNGLVSSIAEEDMIQAGKHPGKTNLTDLDNALNILKFLLDRPAATIMKHNNPSAAAL